MEPSEEFILTHRKILFLDEWLFYGLLLTLFLLDHWWVMVPVTILGTVFLLNSYRRQWAMEKKRFGDIHSSEPQPTKDLDEPKLRPEVHSNEHEHARLAQ